MQISEAAAGAPAAGAEPCRFPKLEECAHFHYERVQLPQLQVILQTNMDQSLHSQHTNEEEDSEWFMVQVTSGEECWLVQRNFDNFKMLDDQLHQCIYDRKISQLPDLSSQSPNDEDLELKLILYLERFSKVANNSINCGPVLNWLQMDNKGHRLLVPSEESRSINTPAVAAAYSIRRYVSQARDELNLEVGDMISVIDMASPGESMWWRGKRGFQVGFFPQHCVHIIGDKVPRNMPLPPPVVGSLALTPIKPVLRKHGKLITFFRSFILNRPSRRRLKQSGILKERVFGCDLGEHLLNSGHEIPMVLKCCAEFIEKKGIVDGIYRLSGVTSNIQKLRNAFDEDRVPNLYTEDILQDIHSVASLLKMYFRELPNPLCTYQLYQSFVNAVQGCSTAIRNSESDHQRLLKMREAVQKLPPPHYRTLEYLMRHLAKVAEHGTSTGMTTRNVAIVWAPNLLRCEALEVGGVAALQGVGVQAVVTEFLICYADLIFCDHLPNLDHPLREEANVKKCRPNSLAISTPTKLITLEEARNKHLVNKGEDCNYIEVGGGPKNLPKKYHTVIELPARKRSHSKRSPLGWKTLFSKKGSSQSVINKNRKASTPIIISEKSINESDLGDMKRKLRTVKSAESLTSGHSEPASCEDILGPLQPLSKLPGHNRSVSHESYFDILNNSQNNSEGSLYELSEIQMNFDLEESEMRIFSEDESLVSSPRVQKEGQRRVLTRARPEDFSSATNSGNPSPKKQARVVLSPESMSRKRTRLEDQLSDIQYIDCTTPDNTVSTTAVIHTLPESPVPGHKFDGYIPKNKSPRNSDNLTPKEGEKPSTVIVKSFTDVDIERKFLGVTGALTPTPQSPTYKQLDSASTNSTPSPGEITYTQLNKQLIFDTLESKPHYENVLTTISIIYKSPPRSIANSPIKSPVENNSLGIYENVVLNPEKAVVPTSTASLPLDEASQPDLDSKTLSVPSTEERPKSLSALEDLSSRDSGTLKPNLSASALCSNSEQLSLSSDQKTFSSQSSGSNIQYTLSQSSAPYHFMEGISNTDLSLSEVQNSDLTVSQGSLSFPPSPKNSISPNVSQLFQGSSENLLSEAEKQSEANSLETLDLLSTDTDLHRSTSVNLIDFSPLESMENSGRFNVNDKRKSSESESLDENAVYQQVKYLRRSVHEVNALLDNIEGEKEENEQEQVFDSLEEDNHVYENIEGESLREDVSKTEQETKEILKEDVEEVQKTEEKVSVKSLTSRFEEKEAMSLPVISLGKSIDKPKSSMKDKSPEGSTNCRMRKFYEKDSLPPCLRARNLKSQLKTRSLDEEEFKKEFGESLGQRRVSLDESLSYKTNSLPKRLNPPKRIPVDGNIVSLHLAHSTENVGGDTGEEELKKRERIEKYKEERRKFLQDKYRTESFKEDKDVLMSKLRIYKGKEDIEKKDIEAKITRQRKRNEDNDSLEEDSTSLKSPEAKSSCSKLEKERDSKIKQRAAIFEQKSSDVKNKTDHIFAKLEDPKGKFARRKDEEGEKKEEEEVDLRNKKEMKEERRRHTFECRERESEVERLRRISLETKRKEKTSPTYCIKDMKAIFESKSKQ